MKVKIGNYPTWTGPYQIAEKLLFWLDKDKDERVHKFGTWLSGGEDKDSLLARFCNWVHSKQKRQVIVKLDRWDTWNMDSTLALIVLPMLKQLKVSQHGCGSVDDGDVPTHLSSIAAPAKENEWDIDSNHFKRWEWVMGELIWTFEQMQPDCDWDAQYHTGVHDTKWIPNEIDGKVVTYTMEKGPLDTHVFDSIGHQRHQDRITAGLKLFGKYYQNLWD